MTDLFRKKNVADAISSAEKENEHGTGLDKNLSLFDLTAFGIAAIIGAGIFSTIGSASYNGGPGVVFLFMFTALACGFAAFAYAEFASMLPVAGSAYTYSYVAFGELIAWIIGWALIMEYAVGNITVAVSWSSYFTSLYESAIPALQHSDWLGWLFKHFPTEIAAWAQVDYISARDGFEHANGLLQGGKQLTDLTASDLEAYRAWTGAPNIGGLRMILDIPAIVMSILITALVYVGIKESKRVGNAMVMLKMLVVLAVIFVGVFYVHAENWNPFLPNGFGGVMAGVSSVFFAYIGFDALSTTAEECKNPQRDLPKAMVYSIVICTILYIIIALVLTGIISYKELNVSDPLAHVFDKINLKWFSGVIAISAVIAMAGVFLVFQLGQPRIWMTMSRDGLLPKKFAHIHPKYKTPDFSTLMTGVMVIVPMLFIPSALVLDLCSMGTLFAFVLVCGGVLKLQVTPNAPQGKFKTPYINGKFLYPALLLIAGLLLMNLNSESTLKWLTNAPEMRHHEDILSDISPEQAASVKNYLMLTDSAAMAAANNDVADFLSAVPEENYAATVRDLPVDDSYKYDTGWSLFQHKIPMWLFIITCLVLAVYAYRYSLSLIPLLGLVFCFYMMAQIPAKSWLGFLIWLIIGLVIYFGYSQKNSKLAGKTS